MTTSITGYEFVELLGQGGMGQVYAAKDIQLDRIVAVKLLNDSRDPELVKRFESEVRSIASLSHPNITRLYGYAKTENGQPYCVLEYISGGSLAQRMKGKLASPTIAAEVVSTLARAIQVAHEHGIIHRDLKPSNILIDQGDEETKGSSVAANVHQVDTIKNMQAEVSTKSPLAIFRLMDRRLRSEGQSSATLSIRSSQLRIADFGLARRIDEDSRVTRTGQVVGTPAYMAPEQATGMLTKPGPSVDIYSLGAILYELLTGRPPFLGTDSLETLMLLMTSDVLPPKFLQPTIPQDLSTICCKCLEKKSSRRYRSAEELADDLNRFLQGRPINARAATLWERGMRWTLRNPWKATAAGILAASFVASVFGLQVVRSAYAEVRTTNAKISKANSELSKKNSELETTLGLAKESLDGVVIQLRDELYDVPHARPIMMKTALNALSVQRRLYKLKPTDLQLARGYVSAIYENEMLQWFYGDKNKSKILLDEMDEALATITTAFPHDVELQVLQIKAWKERDSFETETDRPQQAVRHTLIDSRLETLLSQHADSVEVLRLALMIYSQRASTAARVKDFARQHELAQEMVRLAESHVQIETRSDEGQFALVWLANSNKTLARSLVNLGQAEEACKRLTVAIENLRNRFRNGNGETYRNELASLYGLLGNTRSGLADSASAIKSLSEAIEIYAGLVKDYPEELSYLNSLAEALLRCAKVHLEGDQTDIAREQLNSSAIYLKQVLGKEPGDAKALQLRDDLTKMVEQLPEPKPEN
jgi:serine/threonine protein kinase